MNVQASADERVVYLDKCIAAWNDSLMEGSEGIRLKEMNDVKAVQLLKGLRDEGLRLHSLPNIKEFLTGYQWFSMTYLMERTMKNMEKLFYVLVVPLNLKPKNVFKWQRVLPANMFRNQPTND